VNAHLEIENKLEDLMKYRFGKIEDRFVKIENYVLKEIDEVIKDEVEIIRATISDGKFYVKEGHVTKSLEELK
jgi:hypothetical protein